MAAAAAAARDRISEEIVRKSVNALLKWKTNSQPKPISQEADEQEQEETGDSYMYLSITLAKIPPRALTLTPHRIPLAHSLLPPDLSLLTFCLIVDGKKLNAETATKNIKTAGISYQVKVIKLAKLKSDYKSYESKKKFHESFDVFLAVKDVVAELPNVLGKVFYKKRRKVPVPVELGPGGAGWKEEIERACGSSLLCLSSGTCSVVRVGLFGVHEREEIEENVFRAVDGVLGVVPRSWRGVKCLHLRFSDSVALPLYERRVKVVVEEGGGVGEAKSGGLVGKKRSRN